MFHIFTQVLTANGSNTNTDHHQPNLSPAAVVVGLKELVFYHSNLGDEVDDSWMLRSLVAAVVATTSGDQLDRLLGPQDTQGDVDFWCRYIERLSDM